MAAAVIRVPSGKLDYTLGNRRTLAVVILLLQCSVMIPPALSYRADTSPARNSVQLPRVAAGVPGLELHEKNPFSKHAFSQRKKIKRGEGGTAPQVGGAFHEVTSEQCTSMGLEKCGDMCVEQCCNAESALVCPVNSYCAANEEYEFCCERGHTCDEPIGCLNLSDIRCVNNARGLINDEGQEKVCCYPGFEVCTNIGDGFPACMPIGTVEVPPKPPKHTDTAPLNSDVAKPSPTPSRIYSNPKPTIAVVSDIVDNSYRHEVKENNKRGEESSSDTSHGYAGIGAIIGGAVGGFIGLTILGVCAFLTRKHYRKTQGYEEEEGGCEFNELDRKGLGFTVDEIPEPRSSNSWLDLEDEGTKRKLSSDGGVSSWSHPTLYGTPSTDRSRHSSRVEKASTDRSRHSSRIGKTSTDRSRQSSRMGKTNTDRSRRMRNTHAGEWSRSRERERGLEMSQSWRSRSYSTDTGDDSMFVRRPPGSVTSYTSPSASPPPTQEKVWSWRQYQEDEGEDDEPPAFANRHISPRLQPVYKDPHSSVYPVPPRNPRAITHNNYCNQRRQPLSPKITSSRNW